VEKRLLHVIKHLQHVISTHSTLNHMHTENARLRNSNRALR
jgi:hypothetical protein